MSDFRYVSHCQTLNKPETWLIDADWLHLSCGFLDCQLRFSKVQYPPDLSTPDHISYDTTKKVL